MPALLTDVTYVLTLLILVAVVAALSWLAGALLFMFVIGRIIAWLNGAPFGIGERVVILAGPNRGRIVVVYAVWEERGQVRVGLGKADAENFDDVFPMFHVRRA